MLKQIVDEPDVFQFGVDKYLEMMQVNAFNEECSRIKWIMFENYVELLYINDAITIQTQSTKLVLASICDGDIHWIT